MGAQRCIGCANQRRGRTRRCDWIALAENAPSGGLGVDCAPRGGVPGQCAYAADGERLGRKRVAHRGVVGATTDSATHHVVVVSRGDSLAGIEQGRLIAIDASER